MSFWTAIVIIVAIVSLAEIIKSKHRTRLSRESRQENAIAPDPEARRDLEDLRERIKVLERIATDGNTLDASETRRIAQEIEALRDRQES